MTLYRWTAAVVFVLLAGCQAASDHGSSTAPEMSLKIYQVPAAQTDRLRTALAGVFGDSTSRISVAAPGKLLIYAPRSAQASIGDALSSLEKAPSQVDDIPLEAHFWVIDARQGQGPDDAQLKPLEPALTALRQTLGPMQFRLDQAVTNTLGYGGPTRMTGSDGKTFSLRARPLRKDAVDLQVEYQDAANRGSGIHELSTRIDARLGQTIVLGQAPIRCLQSPQTPGIVATNNRTVSCGEDDTLRLLVLRLVPSAAH
jgi:hypothetical protein